MFYLGAVGFYNNATIYLIVMICEFMLALFESKRTFEDDQFKDQLHASALTQL